MSAMGLSEAADAIHALFVGERGDKARRGALLIASVALAHRGAVPRIVLDEVPGG
jgi:hypothetical protein